MQAGEELIELELAGAAPETDIDDPVCAYLLEHGRLKGTDLRRAQTYQEQHGGDLVTLLVRLGLVSERDVAEAESGLLSLPLVRTADLPDEAPELPDVSLRFLKQNLILPIAESNGDLTVVMTIRDEFAQGAAMASGRTSSSGYRLEIENARKTVGGGRSVMGQIVETPPATKAKSTMSSTCATRPPRPGDPPGQPDHAAAVESRASDITSSRLKTA
jgi:general secretion pathway protein E